MWQIYLGIGVTLFITGANCCFWAICKFNDMAHIEKNLIEIKADVKQLLENDNELSNRMTKQETKCQERHSRKRNKIVRE
jgi:hypothetical protein